MKKIIVTIFFIFLANFSYSQYGPTTWSPLIWNPNPDNHWININDFNRGFENGYEPWGFLKPHFGDTGPTCVSSTPQVLALSQNGANSIVDIPIRIRYYLSYTNPTTGVVTNHLPHTIDVSWIANATGNQLEPGPITFEASETALAGSYTVNILNSYNTITFDTFEIRSSTFELISPPNVSGINSINVTQPLCLGVPATVTLNSSLMADGTYNIYYELSGANTSTMLRSITFSGGVGSITLDASEIPNIGTTNISNIIISISNYYGCDAVYPINSSFVISPFPDTNGSNSLLVAQPLCKNDAAAVTLNSSLMANGTYTITYSLSGANTLGSSTASVTFASGVATFNVPASEILNVGTTNIAVTSLANATSLCSASYPSAVTGSFTVSPRPNITGTNSMN